MFLPIFRKVWYGQQVVVKRNHNRVIHRSFRHQVLGRCCGEVRLEGHSRLLKDRCVGRVSGTVSGVGGFVLDMIHLQETGILTEVNVRSLYGDSFHSPLFCSYRVERTEFILLLSSQHMTVVNPCLTYCCQISCLFSFLPSSLLLPFLSPYRYPS